MTACPGEFWPSRAESRYLTLLASDPREVARRLRERAGGEQTR
jgi:hypothetical protein